MKKVAAAAAVGLVWVISPNAAIAIISGLILSYLFPFTSTRDRSIEQQVGEVQHFSGRKTTSYPTDAKLQEMIKQVNRDDVVYHSGFFSMLARKMVHENSSFNNELLVDSFEVWDKEGKGYVCISEVEMRNIVAIFGNSESKTEQIIGKLDKDGDDLFKVSYEEFIEMKMGG